MSGPSRPSSGFVPLGDLAGAVVADAGREVVVDVDGVDARGLQRVALQVQRLGAVRLRDAGVADQHVS